MSIASDDVRALAHALAVANNHPEPNSYADKAVAAFNAALPSQTANNSTPVDQTSGGATAIA